MGRSGEDGQNGTKHKKKKKKKKKGVFGEDKKYPLIDAPPPPPLLKILDPPLVNGYACRCYGAPRNNYVIRIR